MKSNENPTQKKIIESAKTLFVKHGFNGTSIRDIAKDANVQISLIYHYFDHKTALWKAVKESLLTPKLLSSLTECTDSKNFGMFLEEFVRFRFDVYFQHPEMLRLFDWQRLEENDDLIGIRSYSHNSIWQNLENQIAFYQKTRQVTDQYPPKYILLTINAAIFAPFMHSYHFDSDNERENFIQMTIEAMAKGFGNS